LYYFMVQDITGRGRGVCYASVAQESAPYLDQMVRSFVEFVGDTSKTSCVMLDKDESEIAAIKQQMPRATILLCTF
ncbi:hypothetical protein CAPTEDRAFT_79464, partial [Capitella teleta]